MRIAVVVAGLGAGGAERVIALLTAEWVDAGHDVTIVAFDRADDPIYHPLEPRVAFVRLGPADGVGFGAAVSKTRRLRAAIRRLKPEVSIGFLTKTNVMLLLGTIGLRTRLIVAERNNPRRQDAHRAWAVSLRILYRRADAIVLQTEASRECLPAAVCARAHVIPNPIELPRSRDGAGLPHAVVGVGRLQPQKGFDLLIAAFAGVAPRYPNWKLVIWGEGPCRRELIDQAEKLGLTDQVMLPGLSATPGGWTTSGSIFALSSRYEGYPNALGEAMAAGLPVVAFDCAYGPREMITSGVDGLLVSDGDIRGFGTALANLIFDGKHRHEMGIAARQSRILKTPAQIADKWASLFISDA